MLKSTGCADLRPSTVHTGLLESTERIGSLKLKEHICLIGLQGDKGLQTLTGHTGLLKFRYTDNKGGK